MNFNCSSITVKKIYLAFVWSANICYFNSTQNVINGKWYFDCINIMIVNSSKAYVLNIFVLLFLFFFKSELDNSAAVSDNYWKTELQCRKFTDKISYCFVLSNQAIYATTFVYSIFCICIGNVDTSTWSLPIPVALPHSTFLEWYSALFFETNIGFTYSFMMVTTTSFFVCGCLYIGAICDHCNLLIESIHEDNNRIINEWKNATETRKQHQRVNEKFIKAIKIHVRAHEWVNSTDFAKF